MSTVVTTTRRAVAADIPFGRRMSEGLILSHVHHNGRLGALVEVNCETDGLARTETFATLARQIAEQVAVAYFRDVALMNQPWVREPTLTVGDLVKRVSAEAGENIQVRRFVRFHMGTA